MLPKVAPPFSVSEAYLSLNGPANTVFRVCQCTDAPDGTPLHLWVRAQSSASEKLNYGTYDYSKGQTTYVQETAGEGLHKGVNVVSLLRGRTCLDVAGQNIAIHHSDETLGRTGVYIRIGEKLKK